MKRLLHTTLVIVASFAAISSLSAQTLMRVHLHDGSLLSALVANIDSVTWVTTDIGQNNEGETSVTGNATNITKNSATVTAYANGILDNLATDIRIGIIYTSNGTPSRSNGTIVDVNKNAIATDGSYSITLTSLIPETTYSYRSFVYQSGIWFYGDIRSFSTVGSGEVLTTGEASSVTCFSACVAASVKVDSSSPYTTMTYGICYGTSIDPTMDNQYTIATNRDQSTGEFTTVLRGLYGGTTYYYRPYVVVDGVTRYGLSSQFRTLDDNVVETLECNPEDRSATAHLILGGGAYSTIQLGFCYARTEMPTISDEIVTTNEVDDNRNFSVTLPVLEGLFYFRSFVLIDGIPHYGSVVSATFQGYADGGKLFTITGNGKTETFLMIKVKPGTFQMGRAGGVDVDTPVHQVTLTNSYYIAQTEVTQGLWYAVMGENPTQDGEKWNETYGIGDSYPAYNISYEDCLQFILKLNQMTGLQFRMPTGAEWEFAAKGGVYSNGYTFSGSNDLYEVGWFTTNHHKQTNEVKLLKPNELGIYDMSGNVWEWCADWYGNYSSENAIDPKGPITGTERERRGGCCFSSANNCRVAKRGGYSPDFRDRFLGFRLAM